MSLQDWQKNGWLIEHRTSRKEISDLLGMADRDLAQCQTPHLSPDWQLSIAYNAALQAATAALAAAGYRAARFPPLPGDPVACLYHQTRCNVDHSTGRIS